MTAHDPHDLTLPEGRVEWLMADTIKPWRHQRDLSKAAVNKIARDFDPDTLGVLTVSRRDGVDYLLDGQHRLAAIRDVLGWADQNVPCLVYDGLTDEQEAKLFNAQAPGKRRQLSPLHAMYVAYQAGDQSVRAIVGTVERAGLAVGWGNESRANTVVAARALAELHGTYGIYRLQRVLELLRDSLGPASQAYSGDMLKGAMAFHVRYDGLYHRGELVARLRAAGIVGVQREAANMLAAIAARRDAAIGRAIQKIYNRGRRSRMLGAWQDRYLPGDVKIASVARMTVASRENARIAARRPDRADS